MAAVYAVPDPHGGDQVMATLELRDGARFDPDAFASFLEAQADLGTKWAPRFVRVTAAMPLTGTNKVLKGPLQYDGLDTTDEVWWRPDRTLAYRRLTDDDRRRLADDLLTHGRSYHRTP
jgi:fatty-acyl-CoA synthase